MNTELENQIIQLLQSIDSHLSTDWAMWNTIVLGITLVILCIYTFFTYRIFVENKKLRIANYMPFLHITGHNFSLLNQQNKPDFKGCITVINTGKGNAFNIEVDDFYIENLKLHFKQPPRVIPVRTTVNRSPFPNYTEIMANIKKIEKFYAKISKKITLHCYDQMGNKYSFIYDVSNVHIPPRFIKMK